MIFLFTPPFFKSHNPHNRWQYVLTQSVLLAAHAGVPSETINGIGLWYTLSRVAFGLAYVFIESEPLSFLRSVFWWSGNASCITALVLASKKL